MNKPKIEIVILPNNGEPKYFIEVLINGKTYEIKDTVKALGFRWNGARWKYTFNPFKEDPHEIINKIISELSKVAEVKVWSPSGKEVDEIVKDTLEECRKWKRDYDRVREYFIKILKEYGCTNTIKALENGELEVDLVTVKVKVNDKVVTVPATLVITNFLKNFKEINNELKQFHYVYRSIYRWFEVRPKFIVK